MIIRGGTVSTPTGGPAVVDDTKVGRSPWSSKNTVDMLCPSFDESGAGVRCEPVEGYPLQVVSHLAPSLEGHTNITLHRMGKNLVNLSGCTVYKDWYVRATDGKHFVSTIGQVAIKDRIPISHLQGLTITLNHPGYEYNSTASAGVAFYDADKKYISGSNKYTMTVPDNAFYMCFSWNPAYSHDQLQFELGDTVTDFEPYSGMENHTVEFGHPIDCGTYDWNTGKLTVTQKIVEMKNLSWEYNYDQGYFYADLPDAGTGAAICNKEFVHEPGEYDDIISGGAGNDFMFDIENGQIAVICWDYDDASDFQAFLDAETITLLYPLAEPDVMEVTTPQTIVGKAGVNTFISGAGTIEVSGKADPARVIEKLTNAIIALGGNI